MFGLINASIATEPYVKLLIIIALISLPEISRK